MPTASGGYKSKSNLHRVNKNIIECFLIKHRRLYFVGTPLIDDDDHWDTTTERWISLGAHCRFLICMEESYGWHPCGKTRGPPIVMLLGNTRSFTADELFIQRVSEGPEVFCQDDRSWNRSVLEVLSSLGCLFQLWGLEGTASHFDRWHSCAIHRRPFRATHPLTYKPRIAVTL